MTKKDPQNEDPPSPSTTHATTPSTSTASPSSHLRSFLTCVLYRLLRPLRQPVLGELCAPLVRFAFWKVAMQRALAPDDAVDNPDSAEALEPYYAPFARPKGSWQFMRLPRWGRPADLLADIPACLPRLAISALVMHGRRDPAIPESFALRASTQLPNVRLVTLDSGHFLPLNQPEGITSSLASFFAAV